MLFRDASQKNKVFRALATLRYTRTSCRPMQARERIDRLVTATDETDALRQLALVVDGELERIVSSVNAVNVSEFVLEVHTLSEVKGVEALEVCNPRPFPSATVIPPHIIVRPPAEP